MKRNEKSGSVELELRAKVPVAVVLAILSLFAGGVAAWLKLEKASPEPQAPASVHVNVNTVQKGRK